jgi:hypothetical protein
MPLTGIKKRSQEELDELRIRSGLPKAEPLVPGTGILSGGSQTMEMSRPAARILETGQGERFGTSNPSQFGESRQKPDYEAGRQQRVIANYEKNILPNLPSSTFAPAAKPAPRVISPAEVQGWTKTLTDLSNTGTSEQVNSYIGEMDRQGIPVPPYLRARVQLGTKPEAGMQLRIQADDIMAERDEGRQQQKAMRYLGSIDPGGEPFFLDRTNPDDVKLVDRLTKLIDYGKKAGSRASDAVKLVEEFRKDHQDYFERKRNAVEATKRNEDAAIGRELRAQKVAVVKEERKGRTTALLDERKDIDVQMKDLRDELKKAQDEDPDRAAQIVADLADLQEQRDEISNEYRGLLVTPVEAETGAAAPTVSADIAGEITAGQGQAPPPAPGGVPAAPSATTAPQAPPAVPATTPPAGPAVNPNEVKFAKTWYGDHHETNKQRNSLLSKLEEARRYLSQDAVNDLQRTQAQEEIDSLVVQVDKINGNHANRLVQDFMGELTKRTGGTREKDADATTVRNRGIARKMFKEMEPALDRLPPDVFKMFARFMKDKDLLE